MVAGREFLGVLEIVCFSFDLNASYLGVFSL